MMNHEIRTPLNSILGFTQLLGLSTLTLEQIDYLRAIANAGSEMLSTFIRIMDFYQIQSGLFRPKCLSFDFSEVVRRRTEACAMQAKAKGLTLVTDLQNPSPLSVIGDPECTTQIVDNLLSNAIKFTPTGGGARWLANQESPSTRIRFRIAHLGYRHRNSPGQTSVLFHKSVE